MGASGHNGTGVRFGAYELDTRAGVLRKDGIRIRCQEQPLQVLAALAERPGELVTREELRRRVWPQDTFVDFDHALNTAIKKIRAALNDDADAPRYIETVPRRGYRFIAEVESKLESQPATGPAAEVPVEKKHRRLWVAAAGIAALALAILGLSWRLAPWRGEASGSPEFVRLTFQLPDLGEGRFTSDGASVVYSSGWKSSQASIYSQRVGASNPQKLAIPDATLLAVSRQSELAVLSESSNDEVLGADPDSIGTLGASRSKAAPRANFCPRRPRRTGRLGGSWLSSGGSETRASWNIPQAKSCTKPRAGSRIRAFRQPVIRSPSWIIRRSPMIGAPWRSST